MNGLDKLKLEVQEELAIEANQDFDMFVLLVSRAIKTAIKNNYKCCSFNISPLNENTLSKATLETHEITGEITAVHQVSTNITDAFQALDIPHIVDRDVILITV